MNMHAELGNLSRICCRWFKISITAPLIGWGKTISRPTAEASSSIAGKTIANQRGRCS